MGTATKRSRCVGGRRRRLIGGACWAGAAAATIPVHTGEVVAFRVVNAGRQFHEFTIGGQAAQDLHDAQMASMDMSGNGSGMAMVDDQGMKMGHDPAHDRYMKALARRVADLDRRAAANESIHVPPGETREVTWAFITDQAPSFGCHVVGHWAAGMRGRFVITS
jgi:uncharacterized cupredoxin-like copper-binding protein